ncbi:MAG: hypothetical protein ABGY11_00200 [Candidatus Thioglobus sp.]|jgi:hypothetical protein
MAKRGTFSSLVKRFPRVGRHPWKKRKTIAMYLFRRRAGETSSPSTTPEVELQAENGDFLFSEAGVYIITE